MTATADRILALSAAIDDIEAIRDACRAAHGSADIMTSAGTIDDIHAALNRCIAGLYAELAELDIDCEVIDPRARARILSEKRRCRICGVDPMDITDARGPICGRCAANLEARR